MKQFEDRRSEVRQKEGLEHRIRPDGHGKAPGFHITDITTLTQEELLKGG